ncbi:MAG: hypothetical protein Q4D05_04900 [Acinetobacter sp.]|nr:hypothetical protein [Acinetobacter sp.]
MAIKSVAVYQKDLVIRDANNAIHVVKVTDKDCIERYDVTNPELHRIAEAVKLTYDEKWNVQTFGRKLIEFLNENDVEKSLRVAIYNNELIVQSKELPRTVHVLNLDDQAKDVERHDTSYKNLERIAKDVGLTYDSGINTQNLGSKLISFINGEPIVERPRTAKLEVVAFGVDYLEKGSTGLVAKLSDGRIAYYERTEDDVQYDSGDLKEGELLLIDNGQYAVSYRDGESLTFKLIGFDEKAQEELVSIADSYSFWDLTDLVKGKTPEQAADILIKRLNLNDDRWQWWLSLNLSMKYLLLWHVSGGLEFELPEFEDLYDIEVDLEDRSEMEFYIEDYIWELEEIVWSDSSELDELDFDGFSKLAALPNLKELDFCKSCVYFNGDEDSIAQFHAFKNLKRLNLERCGYSEDDECIKELKAALPNCEIFV